MTDLVQNLVSALDGLLGRYVGLAESGDAGDWNAETDSEVVQARAAIFAAKDGGWQDVKDCPVGDVWFALSCGHVVMGFKQGDMLDWEAMIDHDCCHEAHAIKAQPVAIPTHPDLIR